LVRTGLSVQSYPETTVSRFKTLSRAESIRKRKSYQ